MKKKNCWEVMLCGKEVGGKNLGTDPPCPASLEIRLKGANDGENGGRSCWVVEDTYTTYDLSGNFVHKLSICKQCDFYKLVHREQGKRIVPLMELFNKIMDLDIDPVIEARVTERHTTP